MAGVVRVGVLGCADIAARRIVPALRKLPGARVTAVASRTAAKAEALAATCGAEPVVGYDELLDRDDVDAVYVPLPSGLHARWVRRALLAGKHVLAEKPLTTSAPDTAELVALAAERGLALVENYMFVHHSQHARVGELVASGVIGEPHHFSAAFAIPARPAGDIRLDPGLGGGALLDTGGYPVAAAVHLLGPDLAVLGATLRSAGPIGSVDLAGTALLAAPSGVSAALTFGLDHFYGSRYMYWGSTGRLSLDHVFTTPATLEPVVRIERADTVREVVLPAEDQVRNSVAAFVDAVRAGQAPKGATSAVLARARLTAEIAKVAERLV
ncbi:Gfo/Idh/MocA family protein [Actinokineospora sp. G85]|uniref:Gfo/Idh/MocA family protein n=1 Tax=Actinokineospora sp. G85 TaxID=3406626 RepID=UPI003C722255